MPQRARNRPTNCQGVIDGFSGQTAEYLRHGGIWTWRQSELIWKNCHSYSFITNITTLNYSYSLHIHYQLPDIVPFIKLGMKSPTFDKRYHLTSEARSACGAWFGTASRSMNHRWRLGEDCWWIWLWLRMLKVRQMHLEIARKNMLTTWVGPGS